MAQQQLTNVYTILDKAKKGELNEYYSGQETLFKRINFYERPDLIKPHVHYIDARRLDTIVGEHVYNDKNIQSAFLEFSKTTEFIKLDPTRKPDLAAYAKKVKETFEKFPNHLQNDIFRLYYSKMQHIDFADRTDENHTKYRFLEYANNPVSKIMTEGSNLKSSIFVRTLMLYFAIRMTQMEYTDPTAADEMVKCLTIKPAPKSREKKNEPGDQPADQPGDQPAEEPAEQPVKQPTVDKDIVDKIMKKMIESPQGQKGLNDALKQATELCLTLDEGLDGEQQDDLFTDPSSGGDQAGKLDSDYIGQAVANLEKIQLSLGSMKERIKKLLDKSVSYFSGRTETIYEDIFTTDNIGGMDDYLLMHPRLMKLCLEDIMIRDTRKVGKIDVYIDISTSMDSSCGVKNSAGNFINKLEFCKAFVFKLAQMDMLNDVHVFNTQARIYRKDPLSLAMLTTNGGTTINNAVRLIEKNATNALVITDAEDGCSIYSEKAFFIGVKGASFGSFNSETLGRYSENRQVVIFDGLKVYDINQYGSIIHK